MESETESRTLTGVDPLDGGSEKRFRFLLLVIQKTILGKNATPVCSRLIFSMFAPISTVETQKVK